MKKIIVIISSIIIIFLIFLVFFNYKNFFNNSQKESKYYGNIDTRTVKVGFRFIGKIENIIKDEGQSVKKDEILVQ